MLSGPSVALLVAAAPLAPGAPAPVPAAPAPSLVRQEEAFAEPDDARILAKALPFLLERQEGDGDAEWPYEGVYRVRGRIPIGYRVGGTAIVTLALAQAPGLDEDEPRREAIARALRFLCDATEHPRMDPDYGGGYDVRAWGYAYALHTLARLRRTGRLPAELDEAARAAEGFYLRALQLVAIPESGGWAYSRPASLDEPCAQAPFMTGPCLQALFEAAAIGHPVDPGVVERGLLALERAHLDSGAVAYASRGRARGGPMDEVPGSVGRMLVSETTLALAGRADPARVRGALDAFLVHWDWLEARRAQQGTHEGRYRIAPYYFYFAHRYAGQAIELLPERERPEYRRRLREVLLHTRSSEGTWNDRVFPRSAAYGTAMALLALGEPTAEPPAGWRPAAGLKKARSDAR